MDDTYKKLNSDNSPIEIFDKKRNKLIGLYRKGKPDIQDDLLSDNKVGKLSEKFIKVDSDKKGIEGYAKDDNKLDRVYKKEETGVESIFGYN